MCFSATASFTVSIALTGFGIASIKKVQEPRQYPFAAIPLIFAVQQFIEGIVWLSFTNPELMPYQGGASYAYLIFAQAVWPIWVPLSIMLLETDKNRQQILRILTGAGGIVAAYLLYQVFSQHVNTEIRDHHILYNLATPSYFLIFPGSLYFISTVAPVFLSTVKQMRWLAFSTLASFLVSVFYFQENLLSVWCFFAAIISAVVFVIMYKMQKHIDLLA